MDRALRLSLLPKYCHYLIPSKMMVAYETNKQKKINNNLNSIQQISIIGRSFSDFINTILSQETY